MKHTLFLAGLATTLTLAACSPAAEDQAEPYNDGDGLVEPVVGAPPPEGGGVPGSSEPDVPPNPDGTSPTPPQVGGDMDTVQP